MLVVQDTCVIPDFGATRLRHQDVIVVRDRVLAVQSTGGLFIEGAEVVDGRRRFLVSALWHRRLTERLRQAGVPVWDGGELVDPDPAHGLIEPGARADLVLLDGDPAQDIHSVTRLEGVVIRGTWHGRAQLGRRRGPTQRLTPTLALSRE